MSKKKWLMGSGTDYAMSYCVERHRCEKATEDF